MSGALTRQVTVGQLTVTVRELTIPEIRAELARAASEDVPEDADLVDYYLIEGFPLYDIPTFCDLTREQMVAHKLAPSELQEVVTAVKALNRDFFGMCERAERHVAALKTGSQPSNATSRI